MIRLSDIKIKIGDVPNPKAERKVLKTTIRNRLRLKDNEAFTFQIFKKSIDARKKEHVHYVYTLDIQMENEGRLLNKIGSGSVVSVPVKTARELKYGTEKLKERPVIVGMGPAGLFAALTLAKNKYYPIILERGEDVDSRAVSIHRFWSGDSLNTESNVQFGEGGAGTFSDGKLTTLINDPRCRRILEEFIQAGAPKEILYKSKPHIGTDLLRETVKNIRQQIISYGGEVRFQSKVTDLVIKDGKVTEVVVNNKDTVPCQALLLAIGHSARDTFEMLYGRGVHIRPKAFSIGVRIEHPQETIDKAQYGQAAGSAGLGAADYKLSYHSKNGRSAYTFCMCPGGYVVAAASEENGVVTNGMSRYKRDGANANAALLVGVNPQDFPDSDPLSGIAFQRKWEQLAFQAGGGDYHAPAQLTCDFLADKPSTGWGLVQPTYRPGVVFAEIKDCLPIYVIETLKEAIMAFDQRIKGFAMADSILTGVETRSSSPVRIDRNEEFLSNIEGLYPVGEGAGYAGGIMSTAVDGLKVAEKIMERFAQLRPYCK